MLSEHILEEYAEVLFWAVCKARKEKFLKSNIVMVRFDIQGLPLAEAVTKLLHENGLIPVLRVEQTDAMVGALFEQANNKRLMAEIPGERELYAKLDGLIMIHAPESPQSLFYRDPELFYKARMGSRPLEELLDHREQEGLLGRTACVYPTQGAADAAGLSLDEYEDVVKQACYLTGGSSVNQWKLFQKKSREILDRLNSLDVQHYRVRSESMDLLLKPGSGRKWRGFTGRNLPSFEFFFTPDWRGTEGEYFADTGGFIPGGFVENMRLTFRMGEAVSLRAEKGQAAAFELLGLDPGATKIGEFSLVDKRFSPIDKVTAGTLLDENYGGEYGNCHIGLGQALVDSFDGDPSILGPVLKNELGFNQSLLHWDLINREPKTVTATLKDGSKVCIYKDGIFTV